jgi:putative addiction module component (TIGR02574 family)
MSRAAVAALFELDIEARLQLVQELWDSIVADTARAAQLPISSAERALLAERLKEDDEDPEAAVPWSVARKQLVRG